MVNNTELNDEQFEAAYSDERTILCLAGAGCGKTKTLITRVERLVRQGTDPHSILALTFTNAAAFEMKERYKKLPGLDISKGVPEFRTFHSFCYSLIIKDTVIRERLGYSKIPELCDDSTMKELRTKVKMAIGCKLTDAQLENDVLLSKKDAEDKKIFQKALIKEIKKENVITFDIMCYNVCELFEKDEECTHFYKQKYKHVIVDEFQDSDRRQMKFVGSFPATTNFWFCADALQCIYQFRGTTNEFVKTLSTAPGWKVVKLFKNYRSTRQICEFANNFSKYASDNYRITMEGQRDGDEPQIIYGSMASYHEPVDRDHLKQLIDMLRSDKRESAVLCRTNKECAAVRTALSDADIKFSSRSKSTNTVDLLNSALSNDYMLEWLATKLEPKSYGDYIRLSAIVENPDIRWFLSLYGSQDPVKSLASKVIEIRNITSSNEAPASKFEKIAKLLRVKTKCTFMGNDSTTNREIVESIRDQVQELEESQIYIGTIHSAKGLEYDAVYVMGVNDTMFKLGSEEMNNLYYVAITRAKNKLVVFRR